MVGKDDPSPQRIAPADANALIGQRAAVIIDVREPAEYAKEHIAGARVLFPSHPLSQDSCKQVSL